MSRQLKLPAWVVAIGSCLCNHFTVMAADMGEQKSETDKKFGSLQSQLDGSIEYQQGMFTG